MKNFLIALACAVIYTIALLICFALAMTDELDRTPPVVQGASK